MYGSYAIKPKRCIPIKSKNILYWFLQTFLSKLVFYLKQHIVQKTTIKQKVLLKYETNIQFPMYSYTYWFSSLRLAPEDLTVVSSEEIKS